MITILNTILLISAVIYFSGLVVFFIGLFFPNRKRHHEQPFVTVLIAARNEAENIGCILADLENQSYPKDKHEIIVVNDHSEDNTSEIVRQFCRKEDRFLLVEVTSVIEGLTAKKNAVFQGIEKSQGEIVLTTDADCRVLPDWIAEMVSYFTPDIGMIVGFSQLGRRGEKQSLFQKLQALDFLSLMSAAQGSLNFSLPLAASGQNLAYRRKTFDEIGGFSEIGHRISGDDVLLLQLIHKKTSWKVRFAPSEKCFNTSAPEQDLSGFMHQRIRWASNGAYQFKLNKAFFGYVVITFLLNFTLLLRFGLIWVSGNMVLPLLALGLKFLVEGILIAKGCRVYKRPDLFKIFPLWFILQIPYVVFVGIRGSIGQFIWKGRNHPKPVWNPDS